MRLLIVIPTWNRADYLDKAIGAIASARALSESCEVDLFISNNCSTDRTSEVIAYWQKKAPWVHSRSWEEHTPVWAEIVRRAFTGSDLPYDYAWLQGDDDWITDETAYLQLAEAINADPENPPAIVHCCCTRRALPGDTRVVSGTTEDLCNVYGWHDLLGWISSLVVSKGMVDRMLASPQWTVPAPSAYCHSEALLEAGYGQTMLILGAGLIDAQDLEQTRETVDRWKKGKVAQGYWLVIPGLMNLQERGVLKVPLTLAFFRYLTYSFWDRFAIEVMGLSVNLAQPEDYVEAKLDLLGYFSTLLGYREDRKLFTAWMVSLAKEVREIRRALQQREERIQQALAPSFAGTLLPAESAEELEEEPLRLDNPIQKPVHAPVALMPSVSTQDAPNHSTQSTLNLLVSDLPGLESFGSQPSQIICPVCDAKCLILDVVDFNKSCEEIHSKFLNLSGIPIYYYMCVGCNFCFAPEFKTWDSEKFEKMIYNNDYVLFDPDYVDTRPRNNAKSLIAMFGNQINKIRHLDFGGGNGLLCALLREQKWDSTSFDPYVDKTTFLNDLGKFDLITAFEVFEHTSDVTKLVSDLAFLLKPNGIVLFSTLLSDKHLPQNQRINWWYASPRNGHISLFSKKSLTILGARANFKLRSFSEGFHGFWKEIPDWSKTLFLPNHIDL